MGAYIEINDTLRLSKEQGFPVQLDIDTHIHNPFSLRQVEEKTFSFTEKSGIRVYKIPPVRNFLVEDIDGKWLYWGLCHIVHIEHDYVRKVTSGVYKIIHLNTPEEMKQAFWLIDRVAEHDYFS